MNGQAASPEGLGALLRKARARVGLTQVQLSGLSTVSVRAIRDLEQGKVRAPRRDTLRLLSGAMRLSDARRAELELAVEGATTNSSLGEVYNAALATPPQPLLPFFGRRAELRALHDLLRTGCERLVTVVGLPGVGKTRLVQEAALHLHTRGRMPVIWVPMDHPGTETERPGPRTAVADRVRELVEHDDVEELARAIGDEPTLLVLDGAATGVAAGAGLGTLIGSCGRLQVLVTTRRADHAAGGRILPLGPLPVPGGLTDGTRAPRSSVADRPDLELLLSQASLMRPDLLPTGTMIDALGRLCQALDGIPRALEEAASWLLLYPPAELLRLALEAPLPLVDGVLPKAPGVPRLSGLLAAEIAALPAAPAVVLNSAARCDEPWSVRWVADDTGVAPTEVARHVHDLLLRGLIRQLPAESGDVEAPVRFTVLCLVRRLLARHSPMTTGVV